MIRRTCFILLAIATAAHGQLAGLLEPVLISNGLADAGGVDLERVVRRLQLESGRHLLDGESLLREIEKELTTRFGVSGELNLTFVRPWSSVQMPADDFSVTVTDAPTDGLASSFQVRVKVVSAAETVGEWTIPVRAQLLQEVWAATGRVDRGQPLDRSMVAAQKVDVLRDKQPFISTEVDPATLDTAQTIMSPRLLMRRDVAERPIVRKGQLVEVVARRGQLSISMKALALEAGAAGALIRLRNLESHKEFSGQIIHESTVQIQF